MFPLIKIIILDDKNSIEVKIYLLCVIRNFAGTRWSRNAREKWFPNSWSLLTEKKHLPLYTLTWCQPDILFYFIIEMVTWQRKMNATSLLIHYALGICYTITYLILRERLFCTLWISKIYTVRGIYDRVVKSGIHLQYICTSLSK